MLNIYSDHIEGTRHDLVSLAHLIRTALDDKDGISWVSIDNEPIKIKVQGE